MVRRGSLVLCALCGVACVSAGTPSPSDLEAEVRARRSTVAASTEPAPEASPAAEPKLPPRDGEVRRARALGALPPGPAAVFVDPETASPYVVALMPTKSRDGGDEAILALVDVTEDPGILLGRHDFVAGPMKIREAFVIHTVQGEPAVLADVSGPNETMTCGWWLTSRRPRFLCAPKVAGASRVEAHGDLLVESWATDFPPAALAQSTRTGRMVRLSPAGRWTEVDSFRCLGRPLVEAFEEAGRRGVRRWQRDSVRRMSGVALRETRTFDDERAAALLRDAIAIDACDAEPWRLLGRLEFQAGRTENATPALAVAVALQSHDPVPLVDLADALVGLDVDTPEGSAAWEVTRVILQRPPVTRPLVEAAQGPKALARELYESYLQRTEDSAGRHHTQRRRVEEQLRVSR